ncbi:Hypothetical predicted protein, partial [Podarcis lilfordi]
SINKPLPPILLTGITNSSDKGLRCTAEDAAVFSCGVNRLIFPSQITGGEAVWVTLNGA